MSHENSIREELESDTEDADQEPIPRRASNRLAAKKEKDRQERERQNYARFPVPEQVTQRCWQKHRGLGCAAKDCNHLPEYYNSLLPVSFSPLIIHFLQFLFSVYNSVTYKGSIMGQSRSIC